MNEARLAEIEARCEAATEGPWGEKVGGREGHELLLSDIGEPAGAEHGLVGFWSECWHEDAAFIAHARSDVPELVREVRRLREAYDNLHAAYMNRALARAVPDPGEGA